MILLNSQVWKSLPDIPDNWRQRPARGTHSCYIPLPAEMGKEQGEVVRKGGESLYPPVPSATVTFIPKEFCEAELPPRKRAHPEGASRQEIACRVETPGDFFKLEGNYNGEGKGHQDLFLKKDSVGMKRTCRQEWGIYKIQCDTTIV